VTPTLTPSPPARGLPAFVMDGADGYVLMFGGAIGTPPGGQIGNCPPCINDTWAWRGTGSAMWTEAIASPSTVDANAPVQFNDPSVIGGTAPYTFAWNFGDGASSVLQNATHAYAQNGTFLATVWANDSLGNSSNATVLVTVNHDPQLVARAVPAGTDVGLPVTFSSNLSGGTSPVTFVWRFGNGANQSGRDVGYAYPAAGSYNVSVVAKDSTGRNAVAFLTEKVNASLGVVIAFSGPVSPELGQLVNFTANVSGGTAPYRYSWAFGDGGLGEIWPTSPTSSPRTARSQRRLP
jgi:PKD repeat protein